MPDEETFARMLEMMGSRFFGKYRGEVVDNADPTGRGRLQVRVPTVMGDKAVWALPCTPYAGADVGFFLLPEKGTGVWVEFEAGDASYPIWVGCFWADGDIKKVDARPNIKFIRTKKVSIRIDDTIGKIEIEDSAGSALRITPLEISLEGNLITQDAGGGKKTVLTKIGWDVNNGAWTVA